MLYVSCIYIIAREEVTGHVTWGALCNEEADPTLQDRAVFCTHYTDLSSSAVTMLLRNVLSLYCLVLMEYKYTEHSRRVVTNCTVNPCEFSVTVGEIIYPKNCFYALKTALYGPIQMKHKPQIYFTVNKMSTIIPPAKLRSRMKERGFKTVLAWLGGLSFSCIH